MRRTACLGSQQPPVDSTGTERWRPMACVEQPGRVRAAEHRHARFPAVAFADNLGITADEVATMPATDAPHPPHCRVGNSVGSHRPAAGAATAYATSATLGMDESSTSCAETSRVLSRMFNAGTSISAHGKLVRGCYPGRWIRGPGRANGLGSPALSLLGVKHANRQIRVTRLLQDLGYVRVPTAVLGPDWFGDGPHPSGTRHFGIRKPSVWAMR